MKYPGGHQSTVFVEQVGTVTTLFDQWNDCERTVVLYALLKRLPFPNLKFLQLCIEYKIAQNINSFSAQQTNGTATSNFNKYHLLESNSNNGIFLTKLTTVYKNFRVPDMGQPPPPLDGSGRVPVVYGIGNVPYETREDILNDILTYLPLLKPGNEEAKAAYIALVPIVVADSMKQLIPTEMVQQILSYLLIHPAVTNDDRRSLAQWLHHLEEHINNSSYIDTVLANKLPVTNNPTTTNNSTNSNSNPPPKRSFSLTTPGKVSGTPFAAINETGPMPLTCWDGNTSRSSSCGTKLLTKDHNLLWNIDPPPPQTTPVVKGGSQDYVCDDHVIREFRKTIGRNLDGSLQGSMVPVNKSSSLSSSCCKSSVSSSSSASSASSTSSISSSGIGNSIPQSQTTSVVTNASVTSNTTSVVDPASVFVVVPEQQEDLHVSFSKNGTEILDFDCDDDNKSNTQIAFEAPPPPINPRMVLSDATYLSVPQHLDNCYCVGATPTGQCALLLSSNALKTRRSNSLTTAPVTVSYPGQGNASSSSTENLLQLKPRSYSLSIEGHRGSLMSCGSETRLEEMKPGGSSMLGGKMGGGGMNPGMNCIGQWLKSLRLHKYVWLFSNITYEKMLEISEEYLANLNVTKGARHKLVLCIQKLRERGGVLTKMEQGLLAGDTHLAPMLEELTNIVLTPMKPIDPFSKDNIAGLFMKVVEMIGSVLVTRPVQGFNEEELVTTFLWILERALHNEAFLGQMNLLKELKFKVSKVKLQFANKLHFSKPVSAPVGVGVTNVIPTGVAPPIVTGKQTCWRTGLPVGAGPGGVVAAKKPTPAGMERKNSAASLQSFSAMVQATPPPPIVTQQPPPALPQMKKALDEKNYFNALTGQQYSKSSSYPSFSQNLKYSNAHLVHHPSILASGVMDQPPPPTPAQVSKGAMLGSSSSGSGSSGAGVMYHRHSMNSLMPVNMNQAPPMTTPCDPKQIGQRQGTMAMAVGGAAVKMQENNENIDIGNQCGKDRNNICDINSRLEFLCLQMTEQAIN